MSIPQEIEELAHKVRSEIYGRDVREAIATSIEATAEVAEWSREVAQQIVDGSFDEGALNTAIEQKLNDLEQQYAPNLTNLESEIENARGNESSLVNRLNSTDSQLAQKAEQPELTNIKNEVEDARGNESTLGNRLDEVDSQLAQKAEQTEVENSLLMKRDKAIKLNLEDLSEETLSAIEGGSGTSFNLLSIPQDYSVTHQKTDFMRFKKFGTKNIYNKNDVDIIKEQMLNADGTTTDNSAYEITGYIHVEPGQTLSFSSASGGNQLRSYVIYDEGKNIITGDSSTTLGTILTIPPDIEARYLRVTHTINAVNYQVEVNSRATSYEPFKEMIDFDYEKLDIDINKLIPNKALDESKVSFIVEKSSTYNQFNQNDEYLISDVVLNEDGTTTTNTAYFLSGFIEVKQGDVLLISQDKTAPYLPMLRGYAFYDRDKNLITAESATSGLTTTVYDHEDDERYAVTRDVDVDCYYARLCMRMPAIPSLMVEVVDGDYKPRKNDYVAFKPITTFSQNIAKKDYLESIWNDKVSVWNGDSITAEYIVYPGNIPIGYNRIVAETYGMDFINEAIGGSTISVNQNDETLRDPLVLRYGTMPDGDLIVIAGGTNDWFYAHTQLGTRNDRTNYTFYGALHNLCLGLKEKYIGKQLLFLTPIKRSQNEINTEEGTNANGNTLKEYADAIIDVCGYYGIPVLDMYRECPLNPNIEKYKTTYMPDGVHPNTEGHKLMSQRVIGYLKQLA